MMVESLRTSHQEYIVQLEEALEKARAAGASDEVLGDIASVRDRLRDALG